ADRAGPRDQHILSEDREGKGGVHGVAERVEERPDLRVETVDMPPHVLLGHDHVVGEGAGDVDAQPFRLLAEVTPPRKTVAALATDDVTLGGDQLTDFEARSEEHT